MAHSPTKLKIACFLPSLSGGGAERATVNLLAALESCPLQLELVLANAEGPYLEQVPAGVRVVDLQRTRVSRCVMPLRRYLKVNRPDVLLSHLSHANLVAVMAAILARSKTRRVLVEHLTMSAYQGTVRRDRWIRPLAKWLYPRADAVVSVSHAAARDLESQLRLPRQSVRVIYNPVVDDSLFVKARSEPQHNWFSGQESTPIFVSAGRLTPQKDFAALIEAFALVRKERPARLLILGEGELRDSLRQQIVRLGLESSVDLPGFSSNPYALMRRSACFVLSSQWEALPTVLIEALACGCPVVATDCPSGPREILESGRYGRLVEMKNPRALAAAMLAVLDDPPATSPLVERGMYFSFQRAADQYHALFEELVKR